MALGANDSYPNDIKDIKDSLRLLKSKQNQKPSNSLHQPAVVREICRTIITAPTHLRLLKDKIILPKVLHSKYRLCSIGVSKV